jgi:DNA-binding HxlR family transcriptional regulator
MKLLYATLLIRLFHMKHRSLDTMNCSLARTLEIVGEWWSLLIIREALWGTARFDMFQSRLGIARNILTNRLTHLEQHGILAKTASAENRRIYDYRLTEKGSDLFTSILAIMQWGDRWIHQEQGPPIQFFEKSSGKEVRQLLVAGPSGRRVAIGNLDIRPGPGAEPATVRRAERAKDEVRTGS